MLIEGYDGSYSSLVELYNIEEGFSAELPSMPTVKKLFIKIIGRVKHLNMFYFILLVSLY